MNFKQLMDTFPAGYRQLIEDEFKKQGSYWYEQVAVKNMDVLANCYGVGEPILPEDLNTIGIKSLTIDKPTWHNTEQGWHYWAQMFDYFLVSKDPDIRRITSSSEKPNLPPLPPKYEKYVLMDKLNEPTKQAWGDVLDEL